MDDLKTLAELLKCDVSNVVDEVEDLIEALKDSEKELDKALTEVEELEELKDELEGNLENAEGISEDIETVIDKLDNFSDYGHLANCDNKDQFIESIATDLRLIIQDEE